MFKSILVPTDGSPLAETVFAPAIAAAKTAGGRIVGISVARPATRARPTPGAAIPDYAPLHLEQKRALAREHVQRLGDACAQEGVPCEILTPTSDDPGAEIAAAARRCGCNVIFIASHGRSGFSKFLLGSEAQRVLALSPVPVTIFNQAGGATDE